MITIIKITIFFSVFIKRKRILELQYCVMGNTEWKKKKPFNAQSCIKDSLIYLPLLDWRLFQSPPHVNLCEQRELATCCWITYSGTQKTFFIFSSTLHFDFFFLRLSTEHVHFIYHILLYFLLLSLKIIRFFLLQIDDALTSIVINVCLVKC